MAAFSAEEYRQRVQAAQAVMQASEIDTLVILSEPHLCYLTGYEGRSDYVPQCAVLRAGDQDARLILREMDIHCAYPTVYLDPALVESYPEHFIGSDQRNPWQAIGARVLELAGPGRIGVQFSAKSFSFRDHQALIEALGGRTLVDASRVLPQVTIKKSPAEIAYMRQAGAI
ncbi:MAG: aminopeptidase P family N-terminal domain-containing protein, partial [Pseudomonadota bacterium]